jgi:hypothetical protein
MRLEYITVGCTVRQSTFNITTKRKPTVSGNDCSTPADALDAMHKYDSARVQRVIDEATRAWQVDEKIGVVDVLNWNAHVDDSRLRVVGRDAFPAHRQDVRYASLRQCPCRNSGRDARTWQKMSV